MNIIRCYINSKGTYDITTIIYMCVNILLYCPNVL